MRIGLIDVDSHNFPNLALMKLSSYHKSNGDTVEWCKQTAHYDIVYQSKISTGLLQPKDFSGGATAK